MTKKCKKCNSDFECFANDKNQKCWCFLKPNIISPEPDKEDNDCLCPKCLEDKVKTYDFEKF